MEKRVITDANKVPLGRPPAYGSVVKPSSGSSLLKPSYLMGDGSSAPTPPSKSTSQSPLSSTATISFDLQKHHYEYEQYFNIVNSAAPTPINTMPNMHSSTSGMNTYPNYNLQQLQQKQAGGVVKSHDYSSWSEPSGGFSYSNTNSNTSTALATVAAIASQLNFKRGSEGSRDGSAGDDGKTEPRKKRRSRWMGTENEKAVIPGMPTILPSDLPSDQAEAYVAQLQIEELTRKLRTGDLGISPNPEERSPSPEPIYGTDGKRLNTREYRTRKKLEEERHRLIQRLLKLNPEYKAPADYRAPVIKIVDRVPIPQEENPEINFVGLLIGPRGNTLKGLEKDTGAKIIIRGKGSVKEGKVGGKAGHPLPGEDEPLHAYVTSNNPDSVKKACDKIKDIIRQGIEMPESQNDLRKNQLRELALLNGTLREGEGPKCTNCGATSHRTWNCPDKPNITNSVVCTVCGGAGHIAKDCRMKRPGAGGPPLVNANEKAKIDEEYMSLMAELGEAPPPSHNNDRYSHGSSGGSSIGSLFGKPVALKPLMGANAGAVPRAGREWSNKPNQPQPPGEKPPPLMSQQVSNPWAYSQHSQSYHQPQQQQQQQQQQWGSQTQQWSTAPAPPPPVPPPPSQPPPPGMFWQQAGSYGMPPINPPPPPPDYEYKPPPPPN